MNKQNIRFVRLICLILKIIDFISYSPCVGYFVYEKGKNQNFPHEIVQVVQMYTYHKGIHKKVNLYFFNK